MADNMEGPGHTFLMSDPKSSQYKVITQVEEASTLRWDVWGEEVRSGGHYSSENDINQLAG